MSWCQRSKKSRQDFPEAETDGSLIFKALMPRPGLLPPSPKSPFFLFPPLLRGSDVWPRLTVLHLPGGSAGNSCSQPVAIPASPARCQREEPPMLSQSADPGEVHQDSLRIPLFHLVALLLFLSLLIKQEWDHSPTDRNGVSKHLFIQR